MVNECRIMISELMGLLKGKSSPSLEKIAYLIQSNQSKGDDSLTGANSSKLNMKGS